MRIYSLSLLSEIAFIVRQRHTLFSLIRANFLANRGERQFYKRLRRKEVSLFEVPSSKMIETITLCLDIKVGQMTL